VPFLSILMAVHEKKEEGREGRMERGKDEETEEW
jgi:hypothetical protein